MNALSRRGFLGALAGAAGTGVLAGGAGGVALERARDGDATVAFDGEHQAGIATPVQGHLHFAAFDVTTTSRAELAGLLRDWTVAARAMCAGRPVGEDGAVDGSPLAPPEDTGEALDAGAGRLTLTVGLGPSLFDGRFGLADRRPPALVDLPAFPGEALDPARCGGDLAVQACADDPQVAVHAIRNLTRIAHGRAAIRWAQLGYGRAASTSPDQPTPRNLFGFKDGTANPGGDDAATLAEHVWVQPDDAAQQHPGAAWMTGGSYLVARRIAMVVETWDRTSLQEQEQVIGRTKGAGAPLGGTHERDEVDEVDPAALPASSHVRLAHPSRHGGARMLRRGFNYVDGSDGLGHLDAGLFFLAYQRDPRHAFVPVQQTLAAQDAMNEYVRHTGSSIWAVPPGTSPEGFWAEGLLTGAG
ncbi:iron uptake transporter deferrochelatase/peroxidase subunit [Georgenia ruanii]|uniref:Deferrochelatase n=1 Tax=Georgenia ruanii TaxID=348442 RepID=A0A7J9V0H1_9MICO|nr:iron uptake transporter deferrochelatase/peroxidase subunit [Georgenia ruanii]MPV90379.1 deferrochelatase/peroxidase EfeB [Georgenia ruanii]